MYIKIPIITFFCLSFSIANAQEVYQLYKGTAPGSEDWSITEQEDKDQLGDRILYNISNPTLTAYLPPDYLASGSAVVIAPGGGFHLLSIDNEGVDVAKYLNSIGIAAFVLKYRTAQIDKHPMQALQPFLNDFDALDKKNEPLVELAIDDAISAMDLIREKAEDFNINPNKIGFMGFSAGGTLTISLAYNAPEKSRPNFIAPIYAYTRSVVGNKISNNDTPIFIAFAADDPLKLVPSNLDLYEKWYNNGNPAEIHIYEKGGHGFGMKNQTLPSDNWHDQFAEFLETHGHLEKLNPNKYEKLYGQPSLREMRVRELRKMGPDFANFKRYQEDNMHVSSTNNSVVLLGNSITEGWAKFNPEFFENNNLIGRGISGQTSMQLLLRFRKDVLNLNPKAVVIHIGTNDIAENTGPYNPEFTISNIESMIELGMAHGIKVILASVLPHTKFEWRKALGDRSDEIIDLNNRMKQLCEKYNLSYVDYHSVMKNKSNGMDPHLAADGVHPEPAGFKIMEETLIPIVQQALND